MRKTQTRKISFRHLHLMNLRKEGELKTIVNSNGATITLNLQKHFLLGVPYVNQEYHRELVRYISMVLKTREDAERAKQEAKVAGA